MRMISSKDNRIVKQVRSLIADHRVRHEEGLFVAEGVKVVRDLSASHAAEYLVVSYHYWESLPDETVLKSLAREVYVVSDVLFKTLSHVQHAEGMLGVFRMPSFSQETYISRKSFCGVLCEDIQDPTNAGALIRSCYCLGADAVFFTENSVDVFNPKVVRSSVGYMMHLPVWYVTHADIAALKEKGIRLVAGVCRKGNNVHALASVVHRYERVMYAFGNEGKGLSEELLTEADDLFYIPMREGSESLNITAAVAVTVYHETCR